MTATHSAERAEPRLRPVLPGNYAKRTAAGSGLGLYIARKIALAHGGDLALVDTAGDGVAFRLTLPLSKSEASFAE